jgi:hypothetical protein
LIWLLPTAFAVNPVGVVGGVVSTTLATVTLMSGVVAWLPAASRARAARVCPPLLTVVVAHEIA